MWLLLPSLFYLTVRSSARQKGGRERDAVELQPQDRVSDITELAKALGELTNSKLVLFEAIHGSHVTLVGVRGGWDAHVLAVAQGLRKMAFELAAIVGLPDQVAQGDVIVTQMLLDTGVKTALAEALRSWAKAQNSRALRTWRAVY